MAAEWAVPGFVFPADFHLDHLAFRARSPRKREENFSTSRSGYGPYQERMIAMLLQFILCLGLQVSMPCLDGGVRYRSFSLARSGRACFSFGITLPTAEFFLCIFTESEPCLRTDSLPRTEWMLLMLPLAYHIHS